MTTRETSVMRVAKMTIPIKAPQLSSVAKYTLKGRDPEVAPIDKRNLRFILLQMRARGTWVTIDRGYMTGVQPPVIESHLPRAAG